MDIHRPHNDVSLATVKESPVLQKAGYTENEFEKSRNPVPTMEGSCFCSRTLYHLTDPGTEWTFAKQKWQRTKGYLDDQKHRNAVILPGFAERSYA